MESWELLSLQETIIPDVTQVEMFMVKVMFKRFIHTMCGLFLRLLSSLSNGSYGDRRLN